MFKTQELFSADATNDTLNSVPKELKAANCVKRAWLLPRHVCYTVRGFELYLNYFHTEFYVLSKSTSRQKRTDSLFAFENEVLDVFFKESDLSQYKEILMCVVLKNGEAKLYKFEYDSNLWTTHLTIKLGIDPTTTLATVIFSEDLSVATWCETSGSGAFDYSVYYQQVSFDSAHKISDENEDAKPLKLLQKCPAINFATLGSLIVCLPILQKPADIFLLWVNNRLSLLNTKGTILYKSDSISKSFLDILFISAGKWKTNSDMPSLHHTNTNHEKLYILTQKKYLLALNKNGSVYRTVGLKTTNTENPMGFVVYANIICIFISEKIEIFEIEDGVHLESMDLYTFGPVSYVWHCNSSVNMFGFISKNTFYKMLPLTASEILNHENPETVMVLYGNPEWEFLSKISSIVKKRPIMPSDLISNASLQSKALLLALLQYSRESTDSFQYCQEYKTADERFISSRLNKILAPLVDAFLKLDEVRFKLIDN